MQKPAICPWMTFSYVISRYQAALSSYQETLEARQAIYTAYQGTLDAYQKLRTYYQIAQKRHDNELQKDIVGKLVSTANSLKSIADKLKPVGDSIQKSDENVKHWKHILDLIKPTRP
jgi:flagellar biosynthesis chaperone FliJ